MKVRIRKNSWFYNFADWFEVTHEKNLCNFFWKLIGHMCLAVSLAVTLFTAFILVILYGGAFLLNPFITFITQACVGYPLSQTFLAYIFGISLSKSLSMGTLVWWNFLLSYVAWAILLGIVYNVWLKYVIDDWNIKNPKNRYCSTKKPVRFPVFNAINNCVEFVFDVIKMFVSFIKAKKENYCPLIEYVDDDDGE